jgi:hypothetical protein
MQKVASICAVGIGDGALDISREGDRSWRTMLN